MAGNEDRFGRRRYKLGFVEVGIIAVGLAVCGWLISQQYQTITKTQSDTTVQVSALVTQIAVLNEQMKTLTDQLAGVPANTRAIAQLQAEYAEHERRIEAIERKEH
jgi:hypothetical protein